MSVQDMLNHCLFGLLKVNTNGKILFANEACSVLLNESIADLKKKSIQLILPESNIIRVIKDKKTEVSICKFSQQLFLLEMPDQNHETGTILMFKKGEYQAFVNSYKEVVDLKQELESIMNLSGELVTITDSEGNVIRASAACERLMGIKPHEFVGQSVFDLQDKGVLNFSSTAQVIDKKRMVTVTQITKSGKRLMVRGYPIFNEHGQLNKVINISRDVTEEINLRRNLEETKELINYYQSELNSLQKTQQKMIVKSKPMEEVYELACRMADVEATILILGESGVGKEVLAKTIHQLGSRKNHPFVKINCGSIPESLIESELFGYSKGTFTGASREGKKGLIMSANHGTLFLDEIGELPLNLQVKLLQVLQDGKFTPLGETEPVEIDVRFITATNRDLTEMVKEKTFRKDLYYRLNVVPITIPPLRERKEDIPFLIDYFLKLFNQKYNQSKTIDPEVVQLFTLQRWDGNIRELQNTIERLVVTISDDHINLNHLPNKNIGNETSESGSDDEKTLKEQISAYEKKIIIKTLQSSQTMKEASERLGVDISTISRKIKKHGIDFAK